MLTSRLAGSTIVVSIAMAAPCFGQTRECRNDAYPNSTACSHGATTLGENATVASTDSYMIRNRSRAIGARAIPGSGVISPAAAPVMVSPQGPYMDVSGSWEMVQKNGYRVSLNVRQNRGRITAYASHSNGRVKSEEAKGSVSGPNFELTITWDNGTKGKYTGKLSHGPFTAPPLGYLKGRTVDLNNPGSSSSWESQGKVFRVPGS
jgi:hypothetical protein